MLREREESTLERKRIGWKQVGAELGLGAKGEGGRCRENGEAGAGRTGGQGQGGWRQVQAGWRQVQAGWGSWM